MRVLQRRDGPSPPPFAFLRDVKVQRSVMNRIMLALKERDPNWVAEGKTLEDFKGRGSTPGLETLGLVERRMRLRGAGGGEAEGGEGEVRLRGR